MSTCFFTPLPGNIVVKAKEPEPSESGFQLADSAKEKPLRGFVIAVWEPGADLVGLETVPPLRLKVGDEILFRKYGPVEMEFDGETFLFLEQADVYCVISTTVAAAQAKTIDPNTGLRHGRK